MSTEYSPANDEPIFEIDLGANGGKLAPSTIESLITWLQKEGSAWQWVNAQSFGSHDGVIRNAISEISSAMHRAHEAMQHRESNAAHSKNQLQATQDLIRRIYIDLAFPHTSTPRFKRIEAIRADHGDLAASFYVSAILDQHGVTYEPRQLSAWRGLLEAIVDKYGPLGPSKSKIKAVEESIEELRARLEGVIGERSVVLDDLHRNYQSLTAELEDLVATQKEVFEVSQAGRNDSFSEQAKSHKRDMEGIRRAFQEGMALRAPAEYWTKKRFAHRCIATGSGVLAFLSIGGCAWFLAAEIKTLLAVTHPGQSPDHWRVAVLALVAVFAVWAVRLVVRIFLSHVHLAGDASERVVMLKTYLSLIEGAQLTEDGERALILNALFRPASDGIVKDEGLPPSWMDFVTRNPK
ncbi:DUF6161 domain-containing protein [Luteimonas panaciterrae]|uniref:DUF6161 domain-containing protein n=1 Tax=Luteimonas panaciterrae TaxID=363885 RepID=UPI001CFC3799|nr:DUF6161 domain-containing protein [Luteimonas panaciterrae]